MRRLAVALAVIAVTGALVFPSAAAPFTADGVGGNVHLTPSDTANGDYARLDDGELVVDLTATNPDIGGEGVNADGVTRLSEVFEIQYNGSQYAHVWITHGSDDVTLTARGDSIQSESNNVTLAPDESVAVGLVVDTTGTGPTDGLIDDMEVNARVAEPETDSDTTEFDSPFSFLENGSDNTTVERTQSGETDRSVRVTNPPTNGSTTVDLDGMRVDDGGDVTLDELDLTASDGSDVALNVTATAPETSDEGVEPLAAVEVSEDAGSVESATFRFSTDRAFLDEAGVAPEQLTVVRTSDGETSTLPVSVVAERDDRVVFEAETPGFSTFTIAAVQPAIDVTAADLSTGAVDVTETATVTTRLDNDGRAAGTRTVTLTVDGDQIAERTVSVDAGASTTATFDLALNESGEYEVRVDGVTAGTLAVNDAGGTATPAQTAGDGTDPSSTEPAAPIEEPAGLGLQEVLGLTLLLALLGATLLLARRAPR